MNSPIKEGLNNLLEFVEQFQKLKSKLSLIRDIIDPTVIFILLLNLNYITKMVISDKSQ